jgi:phosphoribosylanthranilate isomerase
VKIQIYTMQTAEEARQVAALGVDHLGITPGEYGLPGEVDFATARAITDAVRGLAISVALTVDPNPDLIVRYKR